MGRVHNDNSNNNRYDNKGPLDLPWGGFVVGDVGVGWGYPQLVEPLAGPRFVRWLLASYVAAVG